MRFPYKIFASISFFHGCEVAKFCDTGLDAETSPAHVKEDQYLAAIQRGLSHPNIDPTASVLRKLRQALHSYKK
jgi:hypothetical protein